mmetsp:Transcript_26660/g.41559  ORF Transcript_26660/g.41559 Transcript_26660/m.41559 type:complete len:211 (+) Transcript_26660:38-670(+)
MHLTPFLFGFIRIHLFGALTSSMVSFTLPLGTEECVYEEIFSPGDKIFIHFSVEDGEDVETRVLGPDTNEIYSFDGTNDERLLFRASATGKYCTCFRNQRGSGRAKTVSFMSMTQSEESVQVASSASLNPKKSESIEDMEGSLIRITNGLKEIRNEQSYLTNRERIHRESAESTNSRFILWGFVEMAVLLFITAMQVRSLERCFENKRSL